VSGLVGVVRPVAVEIEPLTVSVPELPFEMPFPFLLAIVDPVTIAASPE